MIGALPSTSTGFTRAGAGHGQAVRMPMMGMGIPSRGIGFKISPPRPRLPMPVPIRIPNVFGEKDDDDVVIENDASSSAVAGSSSSSATAAPSKPKRTRSTNVKKTLVEHDQKDDNKTGDPGSDSDQSVLRIDLSEREEAFFNDRESDDLPDYEEAY